MKRPIITPLLLTSTGLLLVTLTGLWTSNTQAQVTITNRPASAKQTAVFSVPTHSTQAQVTITNRPTSAQQTVGFSVPTQRDPRMLEMFENEFPGLAKNQRHHVHTLSTGYKILVDVNSSGRIVAWGMSDLSGNTIFDPGVSPSNSVSFQIAENANVPLTRNFRNQAPTRRQHIANCSRTYMLRTMDNGAFMTKAALRAGLKFWKWVEIVREEYKKAVADQKKAVNAFQRCIKRAPA